MESHHIVKKPLITEKSTFAASEHNRHMFLVDPSATKTEIKRAVEDLYRVRVVGISTHNRKSRTRRFRYGQVSGKVTKRAIVTVHRDDTLELF
jgi:large subunit ribosomal protein L23